MKHFFLLIAISLFFTLAKGQSSASRWHLGFGVDAGLPTTNVFQYTLGGDIRLQKDLGDHLSATFTTGFTHFFENDHFTNYTQYGSPYNVIPLKAGIKAFLTNNFYIGAEAGAGFAFEQWGTSFLYSPSAGLAFNNGLDVSVKYENFTRDKNTKDIALRLAYGIDTRKHVGSIAPEVEKDWQIGFSVNPGLTTNSFEGATLGGELNVNKQLTNYLGLFASTGINHYFKVYQNYFFDDYTKEGTTGIQTSKTERNVFPVKAGLRIYAGNRFYISGAAGAGLVSHGATTFIYSPAIGLAYKSGLDIGLKYENYSGVSTSDLIALKLGYHFKL
ncbi:hypothetical protein [Pedobacter sp. L105]|uniref:hypothetical protein n=1 Tax=Pedobacter sp. L105 TaxID=1641871 RepID=UPI00131C2B27|nr:hypothetical protein [Pedobacter sp. L105]